ncbi:MAG: hypothetical protein ACP5FQ_07270 [Thermoplasmata archaeon]
MWDASWYDSIAVLGYSTHTPISGYFNSISISGYKLILPHWGNYTNVAFFPLYPAIVGLIMAATRSTSVYAFITPAITFYFASIFAFAKLARLYLDDTQSRLSTMLYAVYPGAIFCVAAYPTSLINFLVIISLYFMARQKYFYAATFSGIATAAGPLSVFVSAIIIINYFKNNDINIKNFYKFSILSILSVSGVSLFSMFLLYKFGDPLLFVDAQNAWGVLPIIDRIKSFVTLHPVFGGGYYDFFKSLIFQENISKSGIIKSFEFVVNGATIIYSIYIIMRSLKVYEKTQLYYCAAVIAYYCWSIGTIQGPIATSRLLYICIPLFIASAKVINHRGLVVILVLSMIILVFQCAFFISGGPVL